MPFSQYVVYFRPTAVCASCGAVVRLRHHRTVIVVTVVALITYAALLAFTRSLPLVVAGLALGSLLAFIADFWTFKNLKWDPIEASPPPEAPPSA